MAFAQKLGKIRAAPNGIFHADELAFLDLSKSKAVVVDNPVITVASSEVV